MKAVIAAVLLACVLGGILFLVNQGTSTPAKPLPPPMEFDPAAVASVRVTPAGQPEQAAVRGADGGWTTAMGPLDWPLDPTGPQNLLTRLRGVLPAPMAKGASAPADPVDPITIAIALRDGSLKSIKLGTTASGGLVPAKVGEGKTFMSESSVVDAATNPGIPGWRLKAALPGTSPSDTARVTITAGESTLGFAREGGKWALRRPVSARADQKAVNELVARLGRLTIERFIDKPTPADRSAAGLDKPKMVIEVERDVRNAGATVTMGVKGRELFIGRPAGSGATTSVYAAPDRAAAVLFAIPSDALTSISTTPRAYLANTATDVSPADVQIISIRRGDNSDLGYRRQLGKWTRMESAAQAGVEVDASLVDGLLTFLSTQTGEPDVVLPGRSDGLRVMARVTLVDLEGETSDVLSVGYNADGTLAVRSGNLVILYPGVAPPAILGIPAFADLPPLPNENRHINPGPGDPTK